MDRALARHISAFEPEDGNWLACEDLLNQAFASTDPKAYYPSIFRLFERFPNDDGAGVFWSALHAMEQRDDYEAELLESYRQRPTEMTTAMLIRMRNAGAVNVDGVSIDSLIGPRA